jgi:hypothetical protein
MARFELTKPHQNVLDIRLRSLERLLKRVKDVLADPPSDEWHTKYVEPLPDAIRDRLAALVGEAESEPRHLIDDLDLHPAEVSISRLLLAHLTLGSNNLTEATSRYLRASGPVPTEVAAYLDPRLEKLDLLLAEARGLIESTLPSKEARQKSASTTRPRKAAKTEVQQ